MDILHIGITIQYNICDGAKVKKFQVLLVLCTLTTVEVTIDHESVYKRYKIAVSDIK